MGRSFRIDLPISRGDAGNITGQFEPVFKLAAFPLRHRRQPHAAPFPFSRIRAGIKVAEAKQNEDYMADEKAVLEALRESDWLSQLRYREGDAAVLDILDAQRALYASDIELARSKVEASTGLITVYKAVGGGQHAAAGRSKLVFNCNNCRL